MTLCHSFVREVSVSMTRVFRSRNTPVSVFRGAYRERFAYECANWNLQHGGYLVSQNYCDDYHGLPYTDSNFYVSKHTYDPPRITWTSGCSGFTWPFRYENKIPYAWGNTTYQGYVNALASRSANDVVPNQGHAADAMAKSNPSRPTVDLPVLLFELRELPELVKWVGERVLSPRQAASAFLAWKFGAAPLISDAMKLLKFVDHVEKRKRALHRLFNGGLRRRVTLEKKHTVGSGTYGTTGPEWYISNNVGAAGSLKGYITWGTTREMWATTRWEPDNALPRTSYPTWMAVRATLGLNIDLATLWEVMPWSWLIDWFTDVGSYLDAYRNVVGAKCSHINVMSRTVTEVVYTITQYPSQGTGNVSNAGGKTVYSIKRRKADLTPGVVTTLPFLSMGQFGILASLAVLKQKGIKTSFYAR